MTRYKYRNSGSQNFTGLIYSFWDIFRKVGVYYGRGVFEACLSGKIPFAILMTF